MFLSFSLSAQESGKYAVLFHERPLKVVLDETAAITGYEFAYSDTEIASHRLISVSARQETAEQLIRTIAQKAGLEITII
ncbi:hypothetical protein, partial [Lentimicrobium sp.]